MKRLLTLLSVFIFFGLLGVKTASAQTSEEATKKYGITFPISELGNCEDITACKTYCDDPINVQSCINYAKGKGFYKEEQAKPSEAVIQRAKETLGCDSPSSCKALCEKEENFDKCHSFAQSHGISGGYKEDPTRGQVLTKAKETLGCDSYDTCKGFCDNPVNHDKCAQFAQSVGVRGGYEYKGPGGCNTEETCRAFCQQPANADTCKQFSQSTVGQSNYDPQTECRKYSGCTWSGTYCQCNNQGQNDPVNIERQKAQCNSYPGCSWAGIGNACQCSGTGGGNQSPYPSGGGTMPSREQQEAACRSGGGTCVSWVNNACGCERNDSSTGTFSNSPESMCARSGSGCYWTGSTCRCSGSTTGPYPTQYGGSSSDQAAECGRHSGCNWTGTWCQCSSSSTSAGGSTMPSREQQEAACRSGGGTCVSWNNNACGCERSGGSQPSQTQSPQQTSQPQQQQSQPDPASQCSSYPGCSWNGSSCQCSSPAVQGVHTVTTWLQKTIYSIQNLLSK